MITVQQTIELVIAEVVKVDDVAHACGVGHVMPVMFPFLVSHPFCLSRETRDQAERTYIRLASQLRGGLQMNEHSVIDSNGN